MGLGAGLAVGLAVAAVPAGAGGVREVVVLPRAFPAVAAGPVTGPARTREAHGPGPPCEAAPCPRSDAQRRWMSASALTMWLLSALPATDVTGDSPLPGARPLSTESGAHRRAIDRAQQAPRPANSKEPSRPHGAELIEAGQRAWRGRARGVSRRWPRSGPADR